jgi:hypothetical protein
MSTFAQLYDHTMRNLPGCSTENLDIDLLEAAREFCCTTKVWRQVFTPVDSVAGQTAYSLVTGTAYAEPVALTSLTVNGKLLWVDEEQDYRSGRAFIAPKYDRAYPPFSMNADRTQITLLPDDVTGAQTGGIIIEGVLQPTSNAVTLPDFFAGQYRAALVNGALARLYMASKKPWADFALGAEHARKFNSDMAFAAYQGDVGHTRKILRTRIW